MSAELTEQQNNIFQQLKSIDPEQPFKGIPDLSSSSSFLAEQQKPKGTQLDMFFEVDYDNEHETLREKLLAYRKKSQQIYRVGQLLKEYESKFSSLMDDKDRLIQLLKNMKGETSQLVEKQKKMINLSMKMKESLDYYSYHSKFNFDYPCEISCREMYENILQQTLSQLTDGIQYFQQNSTYSQSKKQLSLFQSSRSKMLSFVKSFFIKLFNKETSFMNKQLKINLNQLFDSFYPKAKFKFVTNFLLLFPQFAPKLEHILKSIKEKAPEEEIRFLQTKEIEIFEFQLTNSNHALIGYLQLNMPDIYEESILHFFTYYRTHFHQNLAKQASKGQNTPESFNEKYIQLVYLLTTEYAYMCYCCRINDYDQAQEVRNSITTLVRSNMEELAKFLKQIKNKHAFQLCEIIIKIKEEYPIFLERHMNESYQSYTFGCVSEYINDPQHLEFLKSLFNSYASKFLSELEVLCYNMLPKFDIKGSKADVEKDVGEFLLSIPKLKFCEQFAQKFLIGALDSIVKSIKQVNSKIQSRFQCYIWNIELFNTIRNALKGVKGSLVRKELKFEVGSSSSIIERMKNVDRSQNILKYAQEIFNVLKTGMPVINELTLDFNKYIQEHCEALEMQFVKDILYIYAKNMIEFLQKLTEAAKQGEEQTKKVCLSHNVQSLYASYSLSLEKYVKDASILLKQRETYKFSEQNSELIFNLLDVVYERLFDFMDKFYVKVSEHLSSTQNFKEIEVLKKAYKKSW